MTNPYYADDAVSVWHGDCLDVMRGMADNTVDAVVTDPPYGLEFMGKDWDRFSGAVTDRDFKGFVLSQQRTRNVKCPDCGKWAYDHPGRLCECGGIRRVQGTAYQQWCQQWATEVLRILKPGGHLLAFGGTRTSHRLAVAIEDAGFEIRDTIAWLYGSGFPKSLDVGKAIDRRGGVMVDFAEFRDACRAAMQTRNITIKDISEALNNFMTSHYFTLGSQPAVPNLRDYRIIRDMLGLGDQFDELFAAEAERQILGKSDTLLGRRSGIGNATEGHYTVGGTKAEAYDVTAPATEDARRWNGWGTALKPAHEPIIVARKPLQGSVAANVLRWGTGAINIDAGRVETTQRPARKKLPADHQSTSIFGQNTGFSGMAIGTTDLGRWPPNVALDDTQAAQLDRETGNLPSQRTRAEPAKGTSLTDSHLGSLNAVRSNEYLGQDGGASRFFPTFKYEPKAPPDERPKIRRADGTTEAHPTTKPVDLIRWLICLVTPPGGLILDPFAGSGTTGEAAIIEGFRAHLIEREPCGNCGGHGCPDYLAMILQRITKPIQPVLDLDGGAA